MLLLSTVQIGYTQFEAWMRINLLLFFMLLNCFSLEKSTYIQFEKGLIINCLMILYLIKYISCFAGERGRSYAEIATVQDFWVVSWALSMKQLTKTRIQLIICFVIWRSITCFAVTNQKKSRKIKEYSCNNYIMCPVLWHNISNYCKITLCITDWFSVMINWQSAVW